MWSVTLGSCIASLKYEMITGYGSAKNASDILGSFRSSTNLLSNKTEICFFWLYSEYGLISAINNKKTIFLLDKLNLIYYNKTMPTNEKPRRREQTATIWKTRIYIDKTILNTYYF